MHLKVIHNLNQKHFKQCWGVAPRIVNVFESNSQLLAVVFAVVFVLLSGCTGGTYFNSVSAFAGFDYTKTVSPQCEDTGPESHTTSNLGLRGNIYRSEDERFQANAKYTHHSCVFSPDDDQYDALGVEFEYKLWDR